MSDPKTSSRLAICGRSQHSVERTQAATCQVRPEDRDHCLLPWPLLHLVLRGRCSTSQAWVQGAQVGRRSSRMEGSGTARSSQFSHGIVNLGSHTASPPKRKRLAMKFSIRPGRVPCSPTSCFARPASHSKKSKSTSTPSSWTTAAITGRSIRWASCQRLNSMMAPSSLRAWRLCSTSPTRPHETARSAERHARAREVAIPAQFHSERDADGMLSARFFTRPPRTRQKRCTGSDSHRALATSIDNFLSGNTYWGISRRRTLT